MPLLAEHMLCLLNWISLHVYSQWKWLLHTLPSIGQDVLGPSGSKTNANETHGNMLCLILPSATLRKQGFSSGKVVPCTSSWPLPVCSGYPATVQVTESGKCESASNYIMQKSDPFLPEVIFCMSLSCFVFCLLQRACIKDCSPFSLSRCVSSNPKPPCALWQLQGSRNNAPQ